MRCPKCSSEESKVVDSRQAEDAIRRRRVCESCGFRFTTFERIEEMPLLVIKKKMTNVNPLIVKKNCSWFSSFSIQTPSIK